MKRFCIVVNDFGVYHAIIKDEDEIANRLKWAQDLHPENKYEAFELILYKPS